MRRRVVWSRVYGYVGEQEGDGAGRQVSGT